MNLIQLQADKFYKLNFKEFNRNHKKFVQEVRNELYEYLRPTQKFEFVDEIRSLLHLGYQEHLKTCRFPNEREKCDINMFYENCLFFIQNEIEAIKGEFEKHDIPIVNRDEIKEAIEKILKEIKTLKDGQQITYDDLIQEFEDLKDHFYLSRKTWNQLLLGKVSDMVAGGLISETVSKKLLEIASTTNI